MEIHLLITEDSMKPQLNSKCKISAVISCQQSFSHLDSKAVYTIFLKLTEVCKCNTKRNKNHSEIRKLPSGITQLESRFPYSFT